MRSGERIFPYEVFFLLMIIPYVMVYQFQTVPLLITIITFSLLVFAFTLWRWLHLIPDIPLFNNKKLSISLLLDILLSIGTVFFVRLYYADILYDDAGFIIRYLDHFSEGYLFSFNKGDGAVFGISGFIHGLLSALLSLPGFVSPELSLKISNSLGLFFSSFLLLRILRVWLIDNSVVLLSWGIALFGGKMVMSVMNSGMETPLHLAIVLAVVYFYCKDKSRWMYVFLVLSVISKLDAVPVVLLIAIFHAFRHRKEILPFRWSNTFIRDRFLFALLPLFAWIVFSTLIFGSPLPQSAYAKMYLLGHSADHWFPFLQPYLTDSYKKLVFPVFIILFITQLVTLWIRKDEEKLSSTILGFSFFGILFLYFFYNPGERMPWYYAMPDLFMFVQIPVSIAYLFRLLRVRGRALAIGVVLGWGFLLLLPDVYGGIWWNHRYLHIVENERLSIGKWIHDHTTEKDTIATYHGHMGSHSDAYVLDMTGLNSKVTTSYGLDLAAVLEKFHPLYVVNHGFPAYIQTMNAAPYRLKRSFYDISEYGHSNWRIFERQSAGDSLTYFVESIPPIAITGNELEFHTTTPFPKIEGKGLTFSFHPGKHKPKRLILGIERQHEQLEIRIAEKAGDQTVFSPWIQIQPVNDSHPFPSELHAEVVYDFHQWESPAREILIQVRDDRKLIVTDPLVEMCVE